MSSRRNSYNRLMTKLVLSNFGMFILFFFCFLPTLPAIEEKLFPIESNYKILSVKQMGDGILEVMVSFEKHRSCKFIGRIWTIDGKRVEVVNKGYLRSKHTTESLPTGVWINGPYHVRAKSLDRLKVVIESRCHMFWPSFTLLYDGTTSEDTYPFL